MFIMFIWGSLFTVASSTVNWCIIPPTLHILYNQTCSDFANYTTTSIKWELMQGEYENIQLLIEPSSVPTDISFQIQNFTSTGNSNNKLPSNIITLYQQAHVNCTETKEYEGSGGGWRPDPLFELNNEYGTSLPLSTSNAQIVWVNINSIDYDVNPDNFTSKLTILFSNKDASPPIHVDITLNVVNITLPCTLSSKFQTIFSFNERTLPDFYNSSYNQTALKYQFFDFMESYRMPADLLYMSLPRPYDDYKYLMKYTKWFNLEDVSSRAQIAGHNDTQCDGWSQSQIDAVINSLSPTVTKLQAVNVLNQSYVYGFDEVHASCADGVKQLFGAVQQKWPEIRTLSSLDWGHSPVEMPLNAWNVLYYMYNKAEGEEWVNSGKDRTQFLYHSVSPGNITYLNTFIERPLMEARILFWLAASYTNVNGWLYYAVNSWNGCPAEGSPIKTIIHRYNKSLPFTDFPPANYFHCGDGEYAFGNGDGYFLYPGQYGPVTSSRLQNIRDGLEDLELFRMLLYMNKQQDMENLIHQVVSAPNKFVLDPFLLQKVRKQTIQLILELQHI